MTARHHYTIITTDMGQGPRRYRVYALPPMPVSGERNRYRPYWPAVTDAPCPCCETGAVRWAEAGYVPGYRVCHDCGRHYMASGTAEAPTLILVRRGARARRGAR